MEKLTLRQNEDFVIASKADLLGFIMSMPVAIFQILSRPSRQRTHDQVEKVRDFFAKNRCSPEAEDIKDGSTGYLTPAFNYVFDQISMTEITQMIDLGCGDGNAANHIDLTVTSYLGIDLVAPPSSAGRIFISATIEEALFLPMILSGKKLFFCANFLCYVENPVNVRNFITNNSNSGDLLIVIEPHGDIMWETFFHGIRVFIRTSAEIERIFEPSGWVAIRRSGIYLISVFGRPFLMTTSILIFRKQ